MTRRAVAALAVLLAACAPSEPSLDAGEVRDGVYRNEYLGLDLPIPSAWTVEKFPEGDWVLDNLLSLLAASDRALTDVKQIPGRKRILLRASFNMNFIVLGTAEIGGLSNVRIGAHCLKRVEPLLTAGKQRYRVVEAIRRHPIGGLQFDTMAFSIRLLDGHIHERLYAVVHGGYAVVIVAGSTSPEGLKKAEAVAEKVLYTPKPQG